MNNIRVVTGIQILCLLALMGCGKKQEATPPSQTEKLASQTEPAKPPEPPISAELKAALEQVESGDFQQKREALKVLKRFQDPRSLPALLRASDSKMFNVSEEARPILLQIGQAHIGTVLEMYQREGTNYSTSQQCLVASILGKSDGSVAGTTSLLLEMLRSPKNADNPYEVPAAAAARALCRFPDPQVNPALEAASETHPLGAARFAAMESLMKRNVPDITRIVTARLKDEDGLVREHAGEYACELKNPALVPLLLELLRTDKQPMVRYQAALALGETGQSCKLRDPDVIGALIAAMAETNAQVKSAASRSVGLLTGQDFNRHYIQANAWWEKNKGQFAGSATIPPMRSPGTPAAPPGLEKAPTTATKEGQFENSLGMQFVPVPGTKVLFCIWDVRVKDYAAYAASIGQMSGTWRTAQYEGVAVTPSEDCPAVNVSWDMAQDFCKWLTAGERKEGRISGNQFYRLPTDVEWSVAVGLKEENGGAPKDKDSIIKGVYPWGTNWPPTRGAGNYADATARSTFVRWSGLVGYDDGHATTSPVGSFPANQYGLYDMGGNVRQWCEDCYNGQSSSPARSRVLRGAAWNDSFPEDMVSSYRQNFMPDVRNEYVGFRVVLEGPATPVRGIAPGTASTVPAATPGAVRPVAARTESRPAETSAPGNAASFESLIAGLKNPNLNSRASAARDLGKLGDPRAVQPLIAALKDADIPMRMTILYALGQLGDPSAFDSIADGLKYPDTRVRATAADGLRLLNDKRAIGPLIACLKDPDFGSRQHAAQALKGLGYEPATASEKVVFFVAEGFSRDLVKVGKPAVEPLLAYLQDKDPYMRGNAIQALGQLGDRRAVEPLTALLNDPDEWVRLQAKNALKMLDQSAPASN